MSKIIPRHSLIVAVGANDQTRNALIASTFDDHEILSVYKTSMELVGSTDYHRLNGIIFTEMRRRVELKLSIGERVVVDASNLKQEDRLSFAKIALNLGVPVFYMLASPIGASSSAMTLWKNTLKDLQRGDGVAEIVDVNTSVRVVSNDNPTTEELLAKWSGVTIIGDVHGMQQSVLSAISWARSRRSYIIFLGDVIDYGPQSLEVADTVYSLVMRGEAELMMGNHERKISRWLRHLEKGYGTFNLSEGNKVTTNALDALSPKARAQWIGRFNGLFAHAQYVRTIGDFVLAHASIHPRFWDASATRKEVETSALFGEFQAPASSSTFAPRTYSWIDAIPSGQTVVVGHDIRRKDAPLVITNSEGGTAIFLDTGCGKGGQLSSVDMRWDDANNIRLLNFIMY